MVLGDALIANGDPRGQMFALQASPHGEPRRGEDRPRNLVRRYWWVWLGELARALVRNGCTWQRGLLERVTVGKQDAPHTAYAASRGHRELCALDTVIARSCHPADLATFLGGLVRAPRKLVMAGHQLFDELALRKQTLGIRVLVFEPSWNTSLRAFEDVAALLPAVEEIELARPRYAIPEVLQVMQDIERELPHLFPALRRS